MSINLDIFSPNGIHMGWPVLPSPSLPHDDREREGNSQEHSYPHYKSSSWMKKLSRVTLFVSVLLDAPAKSKVHQREGSAWTIVHAATLRQKLHIKPALSLRILMSGQAVRVLTLYRQAPGRVATRVPVFMSQVSLNHRKGAGIARW